jgi:hypothetical protein
MNYGKKTNISQIEVEDFRDLHLPIEKEKALAMSKDMPLSLFFFHLSSSAVCNRQDYPYSISPQNRSKLLLNKKGARDVSKTKLKRKGAEKETC